ncbi:hypothetical protein [Glaciimonas sp. PAMC28666]|uniref:hypothetical protein n=1 Tax=Glaciimonas sp. PAMC28666 TaxID=2807626 RepID=UPI0019633C72|nr:hypothetical protein [Glaciimonas sp. PAMC28666]QRX83433.1 hypothetical protein JQN73_04060 [Glaciimonas sp. PAMC28666]
MSRSTELLHKGEILRLMERSQCNALFKVRREHRHSGIQLLTPAVRTIKDVICSIRHKKAVYEIAKANV